MASKASNALREIEEELRQFIEYCKENKMDRIDIAEVLKPLTAKKTRRVPLYTSVVLSMILMCYLLSYIEFFSWHFTAVGRILMIKTLSVYDWQKLKGEKCLISRAKVLPAPKLNCYHCETLNAVPYIKDPRADNLKEYYIDLDLPVIFTSLAPNYTDLVSVFDQMIADQKYEDSIPCRMASNIPTRRGATIGEILRKIERYDSFFLHYQNCDFGAVKAFRRLFPRPKFHAAEISPVQYSWVLASRGYNSSKFKEVALKDRVTTLTQVLGVGVYRLYPINECQRDCLPLEAELVVGESLMFTSLWDLEYIPLVNDDDDVENIAVIYETH